MNVLRQHWMKTDAKRMLYMHVFIAEVTNHCDNNLFTINIYTHKYYIHFNKYTFLVTLFIFITIHVCTAG